MRRMTHICLEVYNWLVSPIPFARLTRFKVWYLRRCGLQIGSGLFLGPGVRFLCDEGDVIIGNGVQIWDRTVIQCCRGKLRIGDDVEINHQAMIAANNGSAVTVGNHVHIAHWVSIKGLTHEISLDSPSIAGRSKFLDIEIGEGAWLCAGVIVIPGVRIGKKNCVAAGGVVVHSTPDNVLLAGVPATVKKRYLVDDDNRQI